MILKTATLQKHFWIIFFIAPALLFVVVFILLPMFFSLYNSLFIWHQLQRGVFAGLANFKKLFFTEPYRERLLNALKHNGLWFCYTMLLQNGLGLLFGYALSRKIAGTAVFKRIFLNSFLDLIGLSSYQRAWLGDEHTALVAVIMTNIWRWIGFPSLVFLAAIDSIDQSCLEAAYIDGVSERCLFWRIILPLIVPAVTVITVLTVIGSLNVFEQIYIMTDLGGGPDYSTDTIGTLFYRTAFGSVDTGNPEIGIGSAISVVIYVVTLGISMFSMLIGKAKETRL